MSASKKKQLRNEQSADKMTQRQQAEQKEAKKVKGMTIGFIAVLVVLVLVLVGYVVSNVVTTSGVFQKHTVAATVGDHDLNSVEMNYFYIDAINSFYSDYSDYLSYILDTSVALDQQTCSFTGEGTWADYFLDQALSSAASTYAMYDQALAAGYALTEEQQSEIDSAISTQTAYGLLYYGYSDLDSYLAGMYGSGANEKSYREYLTVSTLASSYYTDYVNGITYSEEELRAADDAEPEAYNSYSYYYYYLPVSNFYEGGTEGEDGSMTYSDEEIAAAQAAAKEAAESLLGEDVVNQDTFNTAIDRIVPDAKSTACTNYGYSSLLTVAKEWISDSGRTEGDKHCFENTTEDELKGYYVVLYSGMTDNDEDMVNVRHILIEPEEATDEASAAALEKAQNLLDEWKAGDATEDSFATLANTYSDDPGSNTAGGLYENVYVGQMVAEFNDWCFDSSRKAGDTDIVETEHGYHIMYFVGAVGQTYRDYMIEQSLLSDDVTEWYNAITEGYAKALKNTKYIRTDLTLG